MDACLKIEDLGLQWTEESPKTLGFIFLGPKITVKKLSKFSSVEPTKFFNTSHRCHSFLLHVMKTT